MVPVKVAVAQGNFTEVETPPSLEKKICDTFPENCDLMIAIAKAESGMNPTAVGHNRNGSIDVGLFQINSIHGEDNLTDVDKNIKVARRIYDTQGLSAWVAYNTGKHLKFM